MFTELLENYKENGLKALSKIVEYNDETIKQDINEEATEEEFDKEVDEVKAKDAGKIRIYIYM